MISECSGFFWLKFYIFKDFSNFAESHLKFDVIHVHSSSVVDMRFDVFCFLALLGGTQQTTSTINLKLIYNFNIKRIVCMFGFVDSLFGFKHIMVSSVYASRRFVINSCTAIAVAIIALLLVLLQFKEFELYWGAVVLRLEEEYWRSPFFLNQFYWSEFWNGKWNTWKNLEWFVCWTKVKSGAKRECLLFISLFSREWEIEV